MVLFGKTKSVSEYVKLANMFLLMQTFLRQNIMIDSGSRLCDIWQLNCCAVARGNHPDWFWESPSLLFTRYLRILSLVVKWQRSAEKKKVWSCFSNPHVLQHTGTTVPSTFTNLMHILCATHRDLLENKIFSWLS